MPIATTDITDSVLPKIKLFRVGNLVFVSYYYVSSLPGVSIPSGELTTLSETCPLGFRPTQHSAVVTVSFAQGPNSTNKLLTYVVETDGTIEWTCEGITTSAQARASVSGMWITADDWPS